MDNGMVLVHHGVKGMKWGVRRSPAQLGRRIVSGIKNYVSRKNSEEKEYRAKLSKIANNKSANSQDRKRAQYRQQSLPKRLRGALIASTTSMLVGDLLTGQLSRYGTMSKSEMMRKFRTIAMTSAKNVAIADALAKSSSNRYTNSGRKAKGVRDRYITREDWIKMGINSVARVAPVIVTAAKWKMSYAAREREKNETVFNSWGGRILEAPLANIVADVDYQIIK